MNPHATMAKIQQACTLVAGLLWFIGLVLALSPAPQAWSVTCFALVLGLAAIRMLKPVWRSIRSVSLDMNLLMTAAVIGAVILQEWAEGSLIIWLFALADWIEDKSMARTTRAIESLMQLAPDRVRLITTNGQENLVSPEEVPPGSRLRLQPGERVGLDARVVSGSSQIMQAQVTGESMPIDVIPGDTVFAGSVNGNGLLELQTTRSAGESTVARIIKLVQEARRTKAPMQKTVERFARFYTPLVFLTATLVTAVPVLLFQQPIAVWGYRSLVILLVGCPCAFIIATPVTLVSGLTVAAHRGILVKGGAALEQASRIKAMVFDKTGTLTTGKPTVQDIITSDHTQEEVLTIAAAISGESGHLLGKAIRERCEQQNLPIPRASSIQLIPGLGAEGFLDDTKILVGRVEAFTPQAIQEEYKKLLQELSNAGHALVCVGTPTRLYGCIALADQIRTEATQALGQLKALGVDHLALLSGDHQDAVNKLAKDLPFDMARGECVPSEKLQDIQAMHQGYGLTAMIGDGINDTPALAGADLGIAMGAGSDQALDTADVALMTDDLGALPLLLRIARKTTQRVKINIALALILKFGFLAIATTGFASLWMAVLADTGSSLIVIACGLHLLREQFD